MHFLSAKSHELPATLHTILAAYRYQVFVDRLGWKLDTPLGHEQDQFDHDETVHIVARNDDDEIVGCGRLLPCTGPYLLESVFPQLLNGAPAPRSEKVWELSRFAAMDVETTVRPTSRRDYMAERVLLEALRLCAANGVETLIAVSSLPMERLMQRAGVDIHRMGPPCMVDGEPVLGFVIRVNEQSISALAGYEAAACTRSSWPSMRRTRVDVGASATTAPAFGQAAVAA